LSDCPAMLAPQFTSETARERQRKSVESRLANKLARQNAARVAESNAGIDPQTTRIQEQLARIEYLMSKTKKPDALQKLSAAHARLFSAWQVLTGTPNPGARRGKSKRDQMPSFEPVEPVETPQGKTPEINVSSQNPVVLLPVPQAA